jgi:hypothetical protein
MRKAEEGVALFQFSLGEFLVIIHIRTPPEDNPADVFERVEKGRDNQEAGDQDYQDYDSGQGDFPTKI